MSPDQMYLLDSFEEEDQKEEYDIYCLDGSLDNEEAPVCPPLEFVDTSFEISTWEPVQTEPRRSRRQKAERKPHEIIDFSKIDFDHIPGPRLPLKHDCPCKSRAFRSKTPKCRPYPAESCFCIICVEVRQLSFVFPDLMAKVTAYLSSESRLLLRTKSKSYLFLTYKGLLEFHVHRPLIAYYGCNVKMIQTYFERRFIMTPKDMASVFIHGYLISKIMHFEREQRRLTKIFHRVIYLAAAEITYLFLTLRMTKEDLQAKGWTHLREIKDSSFDPCRVARNCPSFASAIGRMYLAYHKKKLLTPQKRFSRLHLRN